MPREVDDARPLPVFLTVPPGLDLAVAVGAPARAASKKVAGGGGRGMAEKRDATMRHGKCNLDPAGAVSCASLPQAGAVRSTRVPAISSRMLRSSSRASHRAFAL
jgi:hypothetical protein